MFKPSNVAGESFDINGTAPVGKLDGTMTLGYGGKTVQISFGETDVFNSADEMAAAINKKLENETIAFDGGSSAKASERIRAVADKNGTISFETVQPDDNNGVWIDSANEKIETALGIKTEGDSKTLKPLHLMQVRLQSRNPWWMWSMKTASPSHWTV